MRPKNCKSSHFYFEIRQGIDNTVTNNLIVIGKLNEREEKKSGIERWLGNEHEQETKTEKE